MPEPSIAFDTAAMGGAAAQLEGRFVSSPHLYRNQFVLGPHWPEALADWKGHEIAGGRWLVAHPELPIARAVQNDRALTLIGFMLDPGDPDAGDDRILARLLERCDSLAPLLAATADLGGRWLLVAEYGERAYLITDALGLRHALYTQEPDAAGPWVMSQAGLAAQLLGLAPDEQAEAFLDSYVVRAARPEYYWPGTSTPLRGLRHLLPNHYLDLGSGEVKRYWPAQPLPSCSPDEAAERVAALMSGLLRAAAARFDLVLSITAGIDSRLVLAAARAIPGRFSCITVRQTKMADHSADIEVPARLLARLGLAHEVVRASAGMSADFSWTFKRNVLLAHDPYGPDAEAILRRFGRAKVAVTGSGAEVARCAFRAKFPLSDWRSITPKQLAWLEAMSHPYAVRCFSEWLEGAGTPPGLKLLDLFEWEQGQGNWLAMSQLEFDAAWRDIFTPYNCRALLVTMLGVEERYRRSPDYALFRSAAARLWPEVLSEPVNPHKRTGRWTQWKTFPRRLLRSYVRTR